MKPWILVLFLSLCLTAQARIETVECYFSNDDTVEVSVNYPDRDAGAAEHIMPDIFTGEPVHLLFFVTHNGEGEELKPGTSGKYSLTVFASKKANWDKNILLVGTHRSLSVTFPYSGVILFTANSQGRGDLNIKDQLLMGFSCVEKVETETVTQ